MGLVVLETIQVLVAFAAGLTFVRLLPFHAQSPFVGNGRLWVDDGEGAVSIIVQTLVVMTVLKIRLAPFNVSNQGSDIPTCDI